MYNYKIPILHREKKSNLGNSAKVADGTFGHFVGHFNIPSLDVWDQTKTIMKMKLF